jgi:cyclase
LLKKRIIFTLLYDSGWFVLSRNFRLQRVGDLEWLQRHYDFSHISFFIDELIVLDVSRTDRNFGAFRQTLEALTEGCFVPIAAGGGIRSIEEARQLLRSGADKVVINTALFESPGLARDLAKEFGQQCVVGSIDAKATEGTYQIYTSCGSRASNTCGFRVLPELIDGQIGELYLNSIDRDGTGRGYDLSLLDHLPPELNVPLILAGGVGNANHLEEGFRDPRVDAVATAHLFNFVGNGLARARQSLIANGAQLASWPAKQSF